MNFYTCLRKTGKNILCALLAASAACAASPVNALGSDDNALIEGAKLCTRYLPRHERQYGIPEHLLAAIASTESGRFHRGLGLNLPWPWTINVNGRGYFFDTKEEAVNAVNKLRGEGVQSIDVGCMQVNLHHHPHAFSSVEQAFDPAYNVGYAASFLKTNFMEEGTWRKATGDYHSRTASFGAPYAEQVFGAWSRIVAKVADARAGRPILNEYANKNTGVTRGVAKAFAMAAARVVRPSSSYRAPHMRMVSVMTRDKVATRENGVLVIRPQKNDELIVQTGMQQEAPAPLTSSGLHISPARTAIQVAKADSAVSPVAPLSSSGVKVVNIASKSPAKGQFDPRPRASAVISALSDSTPAHASANRLFVFDN